MVYILLGTGFEETEAIAPGDVLRRAQIPMEYVGIGGKIVTGAHGIAIQADITLEEMDLTNLDMIVLPGGMGGVESIEGSQQALDAIQFALENDKYVAAICAAPTILGKRGWLDGRQTVCYPGCEGGMGKAIVHPEAETVQDGKIITGRAPGAAIAFGLKLAEVLPGSFTPDEIAQYMVYDRKS
jgi:4-methyl-5(b-hydroxyethyl)-thiazole monophosphate biosynthesis